MNIFEIDLTAGGYIECRDYGYACSLWSSSCCSCKRSTKSKFGKLCSGSWVSSNCIDWFFYGLGQPAAKTWLFTNLHFPYIFIYQCTFWFHIHILMNWHWFIIFICEFLYISAHIFYSLYCLSNQLFCCTFFTTATLFCVVFFSIYTAEHSNFANFVTRLGCISSIVSRLNTLLMNNSSINKNKHPIKQNFNAQICATMMLLWLKMWKKRTENETMTLTDQCHNDIWIQIL